MSGTVFLKTFVLLLKDLLHPSYFIVNSTIEFVGHFKIFKIFQDCILLFLSTDITEVTSYINDLIHNSEKFIDSIKITLKNDLS